MQTDPVKASEAANAAQQQAPSAFSRLFNGLLLGLLGYAVLVKRKPLLDFALKRVDLVRSKVLKG